MGYTLHLQCACFLYILESFNCRVSHGCKHEGTVVAKSAPIYGASAEEWKSPHSSKVSHNKPCVKSGVDGDNFRGRISWWHLGRILEMIRHSLFTNPCRLQASWHANTWIAASPPSGASHTTVRPRHPSSPQHALAMSMWIPRFHPSDGEWNLGFIEKFPILTCVSQCTTHKWAWWAAIKLMWSAILAWQSWTQSRWTLLLHYSPSEGVKRTKSGHQLSMCIIQAHTLCFIYFVCDIEAKYLCVLKFPPTEIQDNIFFKG